MKKTALLFTSLAALWLCLSAAAADRQISRDTLRDKIRGAWAGQMIGVSYGAPTEFRWLGKIIEDPIKPDQLTNSIDQDDLYVEMTFARVMDQAGLDATTEQYGEAFKNSQYNLWHANAGARRNLGRGLAAPLSGLPKYNIHADDIDFQIEADFIGIMCPGLPQEANRFADRVGRVMNYGDGLYGGMFVGGMYTAAYFENDPRKVVELGWACIPPGSGYAKLIRDLLDWSAQEPDWRKVWQRIEAKWDKDDPCVDGALTAFNIDAKLNGAYIAFGLLYGQGDFDKTMEISTRCGQDSDCNPSSAAGVLGTMMGFDKIPEKYRAELAKIADTKFAFTDYSFNDIVASTERRAALVIQRVGGKIDGQNITIPLQAPKPPALEQSNFGRPVKVVSCTDAAWSRQGNWVATKDEFKTTNPGAEVTLKFTGTGVAIVGRLTQEGGRAEVFVDGKKSDLLAEAYIVERTWDNDLWHLHGLAPGEHTVKLVTLPEADPRSKGKLFVINRAVIYQDQAKPAESAKVSQIDVHSDHPDSVYAPGQTIRWQVVVPPGASLPNAQVDYSLKRGGLTVVREGKLPVTNGRGELEASLNEPGTLLLEIKAAGPDGKTIRGLGAAVVSAERIQPSAVKPRDFDAFWKAKLKELAKVPANPQLTPGDSGKPGVDYWQITMDNIRGSKIRGQVARPQGTGKLPAMLIVQWAGVYGLQKSWATDRAAAGWLVLNINAHDLPIDQPQDFYDQQYKGPLKDYWAIGNDDRDTSYFLRMYLSCYRAAQYLAQRPDWDGKVLLVTGSSQGGLQALLTASIHPRITAAIACVPAGCDFTGPQVGRSPGWPAWYYKTEGKDPAKVIEASRYYDVVNFASRIKCPVLVGVGLVDETCPPAGILAAMNQVKGPKQIVLLPQADHQGRNDSHRAYHDRSTAWQEALVKGQPAPVKSLRKTP